MAQFAVRTGNRRGFVKVDSDFCRPNRWEFQPKRLGLRIQFKSPGFRRLHGKFCLECVLFRMGTGWEPVKCDLFGNNCPLLRILSLRANYGP